MVPFSSPTARINLDRSSSSGGGLFDETSQGSEHAWGVFVCFLPVSYCICTPAVERVR
jgi:hypothetical protein